MTPVRGFIFDLDGVLTDTAEFHYRAWQRLADEEGLPSAAPPTSSCAASHGASRWS